ncbi:MAG: hypothetical protein P1Q69_15255 [Candidatus Thorarchaeota archaeon]|nr:hypothetical protein [Candidatus Thorarchaeota archaeon]
MIPTEWENKIRNTIQRFPSPHNETLGDYWNEWLSTDPESPFHESWSEFASMKDDREALYTETRVYIKRVANDLREFEQPLGTWQKVAKALAAVASIFLVVFLALSRVARASD